MANEILIKQGTPRCWADNTDYNNAGSGISRTAQIDLTDLAANAARQGEKLDLGATRAARYAVILGVEMAVAPSAWGLIEVWWSVSSVSSAGVGNTGGASGADDVYIAGEEDEWKQQLIFVGALVVTADASPTVQVQCINDRFYPPTQYGAPVIVNKTDQALHSDAVEMYLALVPQSDEVQ